MQAQAFETSAQHAAGLPLGLAPTLAEMPCSPIARPDWRDCGVITMGGGTASIQGEAAGYAPTFAPTFLPACFLWLRADLGVVPGTGVHSWLDQSGQGNTCSQATGSKQPTLNTSDAAYNNQSTLSFASASTQFLQSGAFTTAPGTATTLVIVGEMDTQQMYFFDGIGSSNRNAMFFDASKNFSTYQGTTTLAYAAPTPGSKHVWGVQFTGTSANAMFQDSSQTPVITGSSGTNSILGSTIGADYNTGAGFFLTGKIAEVIFYNRVLLAAELLMLFAYLGARYAIAVS